MHRTAKFAAVFLGASLLALAVTSRAAESIPPGTIFPVLLNSTLSSAKAKPGQTVTARVMQEIPLPDGAKIPAGATAIGHITNVAPASSGSPGRISLRFDTIKVWHQRIPITTNLRAVASFVEVEQAQIPTTGPDRGTPQDAWTTVQIGGDTVYRGGGPVESALGKVGKPVPNGVLADVTANPDRGCRGAVNAGDPPQALWVFSSDACGAYGLAHLKIAHAGRTDPVGEIVLESTDGQVKVNGGAGLLLRVDSTEAPGA
ncbi:MAG TPA: hypothetical protein VHX49_12175 [Candidatus Acidoferrales bacterium]|jgi:hypothetical protein|nr:hypothetical protein [Candidatus Acidoferrales bacterium]